MLSEKHLEILRERRAKILAGGGEKKIRARHEKGLMSARERLLALFQEDTFQEIGTHAHHTARHFGLADKELPSDGVIVGTGFVDGRPVAAFSQDFTVMGGSIGEEHAHKIAHAQEQAFKTRSPFVQINDSGGARIQEGIAALDGYGSIFRNNVRASGVIPQVSLIMGPCAGGASYSPALTDFVFMVDKISSMFITGPKVIKTVTGEEIDEERLGGAMAHNKISGSAHFYCKDEKECFSTLKTLLSYLPSSNTEKAPRIDSDLLTDSLTRSTEDLLKIIPANGAKCYDIREVIALLVDDGDYLEVHKYFAESLVVAFARMGGQVVGIIANQPQVYAGSLDKDSSDKGARFVRFCDAFNIPVLSLVDVPGYFPGMVQEHGGVIRHGAKLLYAIAEATVPKIALILRKAYGGAYISMASRALGYDRVIALPMAEVAVMGADGAANIIFAREIAEAEDPEAMKAIKMQEYSNKVMNPYTAAALGYIDDVVDPALARKVLIDSLSLFEHKEEAVPKKKHGNIPL